jgi:hypothetical protein
MIRLYSNELQVTKETPPTFLAHAGDDEAVKVGKTVSGFIEAVETRHYLCLYCSY